MPTDPRPEAATLRERLQAAEALADAAQAALAHRFGLDDPAVQDDMIRALAAFRATEREEGA